MKTIRVVAAVIRATGEAGEPFIFATQRGYGDFKGGWEFPGGKIEEGESVEECLVRETLEETGLHLLEYKYRGRILFESDEWGKELMHLFTADKFEGTLSECQEGELAWIPKNEVMGLNLWEGDREFLRLLSEGEEFFEMRLVYRGEELVEVERKVEVKDE